MEVEPITLQGQHVRLEPMTEAHIPGLAQVGVGQAFWDFLLYGDMNTDADMANWVRDILSRAEKGTDLPFVVIHLVSGRVAGATRYLNIVPKDRGLEIGRAKSGEGVGGIAQEGSSRSEGPEGNRELFRVPLSKEREAGNHSLR